MKSALFIALSFFLVLACSSRHDGGQEGLETETSGVSDVPILDLKQLPLVNLMELDCAKLEGQTLWSPQSRYEQERFDEVAINFQATQEAMDKLKEFDWSFQVSSNNISIYRFDVASLFGRDLKLKDMGVTKACVSLQNLPSHFLHPDRSETVPTVVLTMKSEKFPYKQIRYGIYGKSAFYKTYRDGRRVGQFPWYGLPSGKDLTYKTEQSKMELKDSEKKRLKSHLKKSGFSVSNSIINNHFSEITYYLSPYYIDIAGFGTNFENEIVVSSSVIEKERLRSPTFGANGRSEVKKEAVEEALAFASYMLKFYKPFMAVNARVKQESQSDIPDVPNSKYEMEDWFFYHHMLEKLPSYDLPLIESCKEEIYKPVIKFYCKILKEKIEANNLDYQKFIDEKFYTNKSIKGLESYLTLQQRHEITLRFLKISRNFIYDFFEVSRERAASDYEYRQSAVQTVRNMSGGIEQIRRLLIRLKMMEFEVEGQKLLGDLMAGKITEDEFNTQIETLPEQARIKMETAVEEINATAQAAQSELLDVSKDIIEAAERPNPFDNPGAH